MNLLSDALFSFRGKQVTVIMTEDEDFDAVFVDADVNGILVRGRNDDDDECIEYILNSNIKRISLLTGVTNGEQKIKDDVIEKDIEVEDSEEMRLLSETNKIETEVKGLSVEYDGETLEITNDNGVTVIDGDADAITVYNEKYFEKAKSIARIIGVKKVIRDYISE
jgi:hypothetical protein